MEKIKVPEQLFREASFAFVGEGESRTLSMSISSEDPTRRFDEYGQEYIEILSHEPSDINQRRLAKNLPILFDHDSAKPLGLAKSYAIAGGKCEVGEILRCENTFAKEMWRDVDNGSLPYTSVGYSLLDGEVIEKKNGVPVIKFRWMPFEASIVPVAQDVEVGQKRSMSNASYKEIAVSNTKAIDLTPASGNKAQAMQDQLDALQKELDETKAKLATAEADVLKAANELSDAAHKALADVEDAKKVAADIAKAESDRIAGLQKRAAELSVIHKKDFSKALVEHITGSKSVADFDAFILTKGFDGQPLKTGSGEPEQKSMKRSDFSALNPTEQKKYALSGGKITD